MDDDDFGADLDFFGDADEQPVRRRSAIARVRPGAWLPAEQRPLFRLLTLIGGIVAVIVAIVVGITSCGGTSELTRERTYVSQLSAVAASSTGLGPPLSRTLTGSNLGPAEITQSLDRLAAQAQRDLATALRLRPPAALQSVHARAIDALQLRRLGLRNLAQDAAAIETKRVAAPLPLLRAAGRELLAADVIWADGVRTPIARLGGAQGTLGTVPASPVVLTPNLFGTTVLSGLVRRLRGIHASSTTTAPAARPLRLGDRGPAVAEWQRSLNAWLKIAKPGTPQLTPDGVFGPGTDAATKALQSSQGLTPDGFVGAATRAVLQSALGASSSAATTGAAATTTAAGTTTAATITAAAAG